MTTKQSRMELEQRIKELEGALASQKRLLNTLLENLQVGVFMVEAPDGKPVLASKRAIDMLGRGILEEANKNTLAHVYKAYKYGTDVYYPMEQMPIIRGLNGENSHVDDMMIEKPDGKRLLLEVFGSPVKDERGAIVAAMASFRDITEQKAAENALRESNTSLQKILDSIPADIYVADMDTYEILFMNRHMKESFGRDCVGEICWQAFRKVTNPCAHCTNPELINAKGEPAGLKIWECWNPISLKWYLNYDRAVPWIDGRTVRIQIATDITEQKETAKELQQTRAMLEAAIKQSPSGILIADAPDVRIRLANPAAFEIRGAASEQLTEIDVEQHFKRWLTFYPDGTPYNPRDLPLSRAVLKGEVSKDVEVIIRHEAGGEKWVSANAAPIKDPDGTVTAGIVVFHDITDRVKAEAALRESEENFRTLVEESPLGISLIGKDGRYIYLNPRFTKMFGYTLTDLPNGSHWFRKAFPVQVYRDNIIQAWKADKKQTDFGISRPRVYTVTCKDGTRKEIHFRPVTMENQNQFVIYEDISERKNLEDQLRQSQKLEAIGVLAGGVAHEFNNILGIILGNTEMAMLEVSEGNPLRSSLDEVRTASLRARDIVRHILSFARKAPAVQKPVQIAQVVQDAMKLMRATIPAGIEIQHDIRCASEIVMADPTEIHQIVMNLCSNAAYAMRELDGILTVSLSAVTLDSAASSRHPGLDPGEYVRLSIKDTGHGIAPEIMDRIFEPFFTSKEVGQGTGMGLAVVYGIIKKYQGAITVQSGPGKGTCMEVLLPRADHKESITAEETEDLPRGNERILFVDDEPPIVSMNRTMLQRQGYRVTTAKSGLEALELFKKGPAAFDLVISDMAMPNLSGDRLARALLEIREDVPIILCTGHSDRMDEKGAKSLGVKAFLLKPVSLKDMAEAVRNVLDKHTS